MDSVLEEKRSLHEERDRIELAIVNEMLSKKTGHRDKLESAHRQKSLLDRYIKCSKTLLNLYEQTSQDSAHIKPEDSKNNRNPFTDFYRSLKDIKEFYTKHSNEQVITLASEFEEIEANRQIAQGMKLKATPGDAQVSKEDEPREESHSVSDGGDDNERLDRDGEIQRLTRGLPTTDLVELAEPTVPTQEPLISRHEKLIEFTDEEGYGRYLDLTKCHEDYLQIIKKEEHKPNYLNFLDKFDRFTDFDLELKLTRAYKTYLENLLEYFRDYCKRAKPLFDYQNMESKVHEKFVEQWNEKTYSGWFRESDQKKSEAVPMIDLKSYKSHLELMELGLDCLKNELQARGLKCGGTLEMRATRLWSVRDVPPHLIDASIMAAPIVGKKGKKKPSVEPFTLASIEAKLSMYAEYLNDHRQATIENVQRKQARTAEERNESDEDISDVDDDDSDQGDVIYNPKNLPLGWDGKPIPYWLYKLHGLNLTFTCEICGNATYKGPKTFQRHFAEWRHAHGMRCLGIPNTAHFANITKIQDAISLWDKLKDERQKNKFQPLNEEEYEDSQGNVVNRKTYEDLKRQGLL